MQVDPFPDAAIKRQTGKLVSLCLAVGLIVFVAQRADAQPSTDAGREPSATPCPLRSGGESAALAVLDPQHLRLADARIVKLAEIHSPQTASTLQGSDAVAWLKAAAIGRKVDVRFSGAERDRYGTTVGHVFVQGERPLWLQKSLVEAGFALAAPQSDNHACFEALAAAEAEAERSGAGYWGIALFKVFRAEDSRVLANLAQTYQIVQGRVSKTMRTGSRTILEFGTDKYGFRAVVDAAALKRLPSRETALAGKTVRIRGWIENRQGPIIAVSLADQIQEVADDTKEKADASQRPSQEDNTKRR